MASWKYADDSNLGAVTLGSGYTSASGSMSLTAGHGARLPSSGDFWIAYDTGSGNRIFKVTARSTDTLTVVADATEGLGDGNISSGETLRPVVCNAAVDQLRADISGYGTYANLPATCTVGDRYLTSDSIYEFLCTATNVWTAFHAGQRVVIPVSTGWSWVNQSTASVTQTNGCMLYQGPGAVSATSRLYLRSVTAPFVYTVKVRLTLEMIAVACSIGIVARESGTGEIINFGRTLLAANGVVPIHTFYCASANAGGTIRGTSTYHYYTDLWLRIADDNTNKTFSWSIDGVIWVQQYQGTTASDLIINQVGLQHYSDTSASNDAVLSLISMEIT